MTAACGVDARPCASKVVLDASALLCGADGKVRSDADFVFYNNLQADNGAVTHQGDNRTGEGDGDDEQRHGHV